jgi:hypothetical protein
MIKIHHQLEAKPLKNLAKKNNAPLQTLGTNPTTTVGLYTSGGGYKKLHQTPTWYQIGHQVDNHDYQTFRWLMVM